MESDDLLPLDVTSSILSGGFRLDVATTPWLRFREKNGKVNEIPCHHKLEAYLDSYIEAAGIGDDRKGPLFRTAMGRQESFRSDPSEEQISGIWCSAALPMPGSKRKLGAIPSGPPELRTTSPTAASSKLRSVWPATQKLRPLAFMIDVTMILA